LRIHKETKVRRKDGLKATWYPLDKVYLLPTSSYKCHDIFLLYLFLVVRLYLIDVLKHLNVSSSFKIHFDSTISASLTGVFYKGSTHL